MSIGRKSEFAYVYYKLSEVAYLLQDEKAYTRDEATLDVLKILSHLEMIDGTSFRTILEEFKKEKDSVE